MKWDRAARRRRRGAAGPLFSMASPLVVSAGDLKGWWVAGDASNTIASGVYSQLTDLSGTGNHMTAGVGARPTATTDTVGRPVARFDGSDDRTTATAALPSLANGITFFSVFRIITTVANDRMFAASTTGDGFDNDLWFSFTNTAAGAMNLVAKDTLADAINVTSQTVFSTTKGWVIFTCNNTTGRIIDSGGGDLSDTGTDQAFNGTPGILILGTAGNNGAVNTATTLNFDLYEAGFYNVVLDATELEALKNYLRRRT